MTGELILHIGLPKTGTTWLQTRVFPVLKGLRYVDVSPQSAIGRGSASVELECLRDYTSQEVTDGLSLSQFPAPRGAQPTLLSNENLLSGMPGVAGLGPEILAAKFSRDFPSLRVILVLRNQVPMLHALYLMRLIFGETRSFADYVESERDRLLPFLRYVELVEVWQRFLGAPNVAVLFYEDLQTDADGFLQILTSFLGCSLDAAPLDQRVNVSMGQFTSDLALAVNRFERMRKPIAFARVLNRLDWFLNWLFPERKTASNSQLNYAVSPMLRIGVQGCEYITTCWPGRRKRFQSEIDHALAGYFAPSNARLSQILKRDLRELRFTC